MAQINTYSRDRTLDLDDNLLGSEYSTNRTINFPLEVIANFTKDFVTQGSTNNDILTLLDNRLVPSSISNNFITDTFGLIEPTTTINSAVHLSSDNVISIGSSISDVFTSEAIRVGAGILFENVTIGRFFFSTIESINVNNRTVTLTGSVTRDKDFQIFGNGGDLANTVIFAKKDGVTVEGNLTVTGTFAGSGGLNEAQVDERINNIFTSDELLTAPDGDTFVGGGAADNAESVDGFSFQELSVPPPLDTPDTLVTFILRDI